MNTNLSKFYIKKSTTLRQALNQLNESAEKILFVVDNKNKLLGALSDGDVRRWILKGGGLDVVIENIFNSHTISLTKNYELDEVKRLMIEKKIGSIPIVDDQNKIINILFWEDIFENKYKNIRKKLNIPVVIMAGGKGTRLDPFTKILPKPLIPINDKTIIEIIIDKFLDHKVNHFHISVHYKSAIIKSFFKELNPSYSISFITEDKPSGTIGSLNFLQNKTKGPILITNCDIIIDCDYGDIVDFHNKNKNHLTLVAALMHLSVPYGICDITKSGQLKKMREKPEYSFLVNTGMYILESQMIKLIPKDEVFDITHLIKKMKSQGKKIGIFPVNSKSWIDIGEWEEYKKANNRINI